MVAWQNRWMISLVRSAYVRGYPAFRQPRSTLPQPWPLIGTCHKLKTNSRRVRNEQSSCRESATSLGRNAIAAPSMAGFSSRCCFHLFSHSVRVCSDSVLQRDSEFATGAGCRYCDPRRTIKASDCNEGDSSATYEEN